MTTICDAVEVWENWYKPIGNTIADNKVWTWVDGGDGTYILSGRHYVNRIGFFVTEVEWDSAHMVVPYEKYEVEV